MLGLIEGGDKLFESFSLIDFWKSLSPRIKVLFHWHCNCMVKENQLSLSCHSSAITYASLSFVTHVLMHEPLSFLLNIVYFVRDWRVEQPDQPTKTRYFLHVGRQTRSTNPTDRHVLCTSECQSCHDIRRHIYSSALLSLLAFFCCPQFALFPCSPHGQNLVPPTYTGAGIWTHVSRVSPPRGTF